MVTKGRILPSARGSDILHSTPSCCCHCSLQDHREQTCAALKAPRISGGGEEMCELDVSLKSQDTLAADTKCHLQNIILLCSSSACVQATSKQAETDATTGVHWTEANIDNHVFEKNAF
jgi:hypothetical protein